MAWACFMNEDKIPKKVFNMTVLGICPKLKPTLRWKQQVRKDITQNEGRLWELQHQLWEERYRWGDSDLIQPTKQWTHSRKNMVGL